MLPTFEGGGTHVNVSGAAVAKNAPNKDEAVKLLEFLVSDEAQALYARANFEYPVKAGAPVDPIIAELGTLKIDADAARRHRPQPQGGEPARRQGRLRQLSRWPRCARASRDQPSVSRARSRSQRRGASGRPAVWAAPIALSPGPGADRLARGRSPRGGSGDAGPHLAAHVLPQATAQTRPPPSRRRRDRDRDRHRHGLAGHGLRLSRAAAPRLGAAPAARGADLHRRLRLSRPPSPDRAGADDCCATSSASPAPRDFRLPDIRSMPGCDPAPRLRPLPLRLPARRGRCS